MPNVLNCALATRLNTYDVPCLSLSDIRYESPLSTRQTLEYERERYSIFEEQLRASSQLPC